MKSVFSFSTVFLVFVVLRLIPAFSMSKNQNNKEQSSTEKFESEGKSTQATAENVAGTNLNKTLASPELALHVNDDQGVRVIVNRGEKVHVDDERHEFFPHSAENVSIDCHGHGIPPPQISWTSNAANESTAESTFVNDTYSLSRIILPVIHEGVEGTYVCTAQNEQGQVSSRINVGIRYPVSTSIVVISSVASCFVIILVLLFLVFVRWVQKSREIPTDLTDEEVNQFYSGNKNADSSDNNAEIYALPYDKNLEVSPDLIEIDEASLVLGEFSIVCSGRLKSNSNSSDTENPVRVAIKMPKSEVTTEVFKAFLNELKLLSYVQNHENVLKILGASTLNIQKCRALIALEFCELGNLKKFLRGKRSKFRNEFTRSSLTESEQMNFPAAAGGSGDPWILLPESERLETLDLLNFSLGVANGMNFLAEKKVIHGDLAARNILLTSNREVKISHFGFSTQLKNYQTYAKTNSYKIPWRWFPLEALTERKFSLKSDVWSFGILLYEIFSLGEDPYPGFDRLEPKFIQSLRNGLRNEMPEFANEEIFDLMTECCQKDPKERPKFTEISNKILEMSSEIAGLKMNLV